MVLGVFPQHGKGFPQSSGNLKGLPGNEISGEKKASQKD